MDFLHPVSAIMIVFSLLVPLAVLAGRYAVRSQRQQTLHNLRDTLKNKTGRDAAFIPSFEFALQKYDLNGGMSAKSSTKEFFFYFATSVIFIMLSATGFKLLLHDNGMMILNGLQNGPKYDVMTVTIIVFAFLGAYIWSIQYLIRRIANFDLSPMSFLRTSAQIILACALAVVLRHFFAVPPEGDSWTGPVILLVAFLIGFFPDAGFDFLVRKVPQLRLKAVDPEANNAMRAMPVEMIDGIDSQVRFRLAEREIVDVENLATENPVLLCAESPYPLLEVLDWIAQAQLALEVGPKAYKQLRDMGIRTIFSLETAENDPHLRTAALKVLYGEESDRPASLAPRLAAMKAHLHVARLDEIWRVAREALAADAGPEARSAPTWTSSSISDPADPARALGALVVDWKRPSGATKAIEALMADLGMTTEDALKGSENGALPARLSAWVASLCGFEPGGAPEGAAAFAAHTLDTPWIMSEAPGLERQPLLAVAKGGAEAALGRHPAEKSKVGDPPAVTTVPLLVVARRQGLVLCGLAGNLQRALDAGLRERLLGLTGEEPVQPARSPEASTAQ